LLTILGRTGRIGSEIARLADDASLPLTDELGEASIVAIALRVDVGRAALLSLRGRSVIDCSGAVKRDGTGIYSLDATRPLGGIWYGAPGCIAGATITALRTSGAAVQGPIHVTAVGGATYAPRGQSGTLRVARRLIEHPHVAEIESATGLTVASFVPIISYGTERGLVVTISGMGSVDPLGEPFDVASVIRTDGVLLRAEQGDGCFTLTVGIDNLTWPAAQVVRLAQALS